MMRIDMGLWTVARKNGLYFWECMTKRQNMKERLL
jgi:hypothetical protein